MDCTKILLFFVLMVGLGSCQKEIDEFVVFTIDQPFLFGKEFADADDTMFFEVALDQDRIIETPANTQIILDKEMFAFNGGETCPCEVVDLMVLELTDIRDYLIHQVYTVNDETPFHSLKALHISASYKGQPLVIAVDRFLRIRIPTEKFYDETVLFLATSAPTLNWVLQEDAKTDKIEWENTTTQKELEGYDLSVRSLDWISLSAPLPFDKTSEISIVVDKTIHNEKNTATFLFVDQYRSVLPVVWQQGQPYVQAPEKKDVVIISIYKDIQGQYMLATNNTHVTSDLAISLSYEKKTHDQIQSLLKSL